MARLERSNGEFVPCDKKRMEHFAKHKQLQQFLEWVFSVVTT
jgi:hypothetical protein